MGSTHSPPPALLLEPPQEWDRPPGARLLQPGEHKAQEQVGTRISGSEERRPCLGPSQGCPRGNPSPWAPGEGHQEESRGAAPQTTFQTEGCHCPAFGRHPGLQGESSAGLPRAPYREGRERDGSRQPGQEQAWDNRGIRRQEEPATRKVLRVSAGAACPLVSSHPISNPFPSNEKENKGMQTHLWTLTLCCGFILTHSGQTCR